MNVNFNEILLKIFLFFFLFENVVICLIYIVFDPVSWSVRSRFSLIVQQSQFFKIFLSLSPWSQSPSPWVKIFVHDDSFDLSNDSVVTRENLTGGHLSNSHCNCLSFRGNQNDLLINVDIGRESEHSWQEKFSSVANCIHCSVFDNYLWKLHQKVLNWLYDFSQIFLISSGLIYKLCIQHIVQCVQLVIFVHAPRSYSSQFLHGSLGSQKKPNVLTESSNIRTRLYRTPESSLSSLLIILNKFNVINFSDSESLFHS